MAEIPIIDQSISTVAPVLHRDTINPTIPATQDAFVQSVEAFFDKISDTTVNEINQVTTKIDTTVAAINITAQEISEVATIAIASGKYKGDWVAGFETIGYSLGDGVTFTDGYNYVSKINNNLTTPITLTNTDQWNFIEAVNPNNYYLKTETYTKTEVDTLHEINNKTDKTTPVDTDNFLMEEIEGLFKKLNWANLKATLKTYFDTLYVTLSGNQTIADIKTFTSSPIVPTPTAQDNSTKVATTAYVDGKMVLGTVVNSTSGTAIDFTGIPSWVKRITVMFSGLSTNGSSSIQIQLGDSGGIESTGYVSGSYITSITSGFLLTGNPSASDLQIGEMTFVKINGNTWIQKGITLTQGLSVQAISGSKTLSSTLNSIRTTTVNGTDTFDAGQINILYEG